MMILTPEFNTLGSPQPSGVRPPSPPPSMGSASSYKAVVMVMLKGGMDSFNMLVPLNLYPFWELFFYFCLYKSPRGYYANTVCL